jgi:lincosamide nucleotidyltransferase A/C/D/E
MIFRILADTTVLLHLAFVLFVVLGGLLVARWPSVAWVHLPAAAWGAWVELAGWVCPLTPVENWLLAQAAEPVYTSSFIEHHLLPVLYPSSLSRELQWAFGGFVLLLNAGVYAVVLRCRAQRGRDPSSGGKAEAQRRNVTAERVLELLAVLRSGGVEAALDGGWGVDALLGNETRPHEDLDLVVALSDVPRIRAALRPLGFAPHEDHLPVRFVLRRNAEQLDFHTVTFDPEGGGVQPQPGGGAFRYPPEGFVWGSVRGAAVPCISAPVQVLCHLGYEPTAKDAHDVLLLCRTFGLDVPQAYVRFLATGAA